MKKMTEALYLDVSGAKRIIVLDADHLEKVLNLSISKSDVKEAIELSLPFYVIGGERTPNEETMKMIGACRRALFEQLGFIDELNAELKRKRVNATAILGGSYAKDTWIDGDYDIDVFVKFNLKHKADNLSDLLEKALKKWKPERIHGSRDYFWVRNDIRFEIVPVLDIKKASDAENVTDFSPQHVAWVNSQGKKFKDDIRLTKKFCKGTKCYGAESYIRGFSGHVVDILTIHYKGFVPLLKAATKWKPKVVIDYKKVHKGRALLMLNKSKTEGPLVLVDPVQPDRNAAAALTQENFDLFVKAAQKFLKKPSKKFFVERPVNFDKLKKKGHLIRIQVKTLKDKEDVAGTKFVRAFEHAKRGLDEFGVKESGWLWDKDVKGEWYFVLSSMMLPPMEDRRGPPVSMKEAVKAFKKRYGKTTTKNKRLWAKIKRTERTPEQVLTRLFKEEYIKSRVKGIRL